MKQNPSSQAPGSSRQKKAALINDITGFGRCAVTVALPVISKLKVQCCPVPTAILSNHTAYPSSYIDDYTDRMEDYVREWKKLGLTFDGIGTGFLGSKQQIAVVRRFIRDFRRDDTVVLVDPVMGDNGRTYATYSEEMCREMKQLVSCADLVTPNVTEGCILTDIPYHPGRWKGEELLSMAERLSGLGPGKAVITGVPMGSYLGNFCYDRRTGGILKKIKKVGETRCGTGDIFSAILLADSIHGVPLEQSVNKAAKFIKDCIIESVRMEVPLTDGVCFEEILDRLR